MDKNFYLCMKEIFGVSERAFIENKKAFKYIWKGNREDLDFSNLKSSNIKWDISLKDVQKSIRKYDIGERSEDVFSRFIFVKDRVFIDERIKRKLMW